MTEKREQTERPHILIVSDDEGLSTFLSEGLVLGGFWTSTVASGIQTLEVFRLRTFDLILIDVALGDLDATEVVRRLRGTSNRASQSGPKIDLPIFLIAADDSEVDIVGASSAGIDGLVLAPIEIDDLATQLHRQIREWKLTHRDRS